MPFFLPVTGSTILADNDKQEDTVTSPDSARSTTWIRTKNRRKRYLDLHPEYFTSANLELAGLPHTHGIAVTSTNQQR
jgi:hypothetical protein